MRPYYPCTWLSFVIRKMKKITHGSLLRKVLSTVPKVVFFKITDRYVVYPFSKYEDNSNIINLG